MNSNEYTNLGSLFIHIISRYFYLAYLNTPQPIIKPKKLHLFTFRNYYEHVDILAGVFNKTSTTCV
jgi:hypothetical protein